MMKYLCGLGRRKLLVARPRMVLLEAARTCDNYPEIFHHQTETYSGSDISETFSIGFLVFLFSA